MANNQLIPVFAGQINNEPAQLCNARLLHTFLESAQQFADWIKNRIADYGFVENQDFLVSEFYETKTGRGGNRKAVIDYHLTLDMAKELSMVERNEKGRQARKYFIECEKRLLSQSPTTDTLTIAINDNALHSRYMVTRMRDWTTIQRMDNEMLWGSVETIIENLNQKGYAVIPQESLDNLNSSFEKLNGHPVKAIPQSQPVKQIINTGITQAGTVKERVVEFLADYPNGIIHSDLIKRCNPYKKITQVERNALLNELINEGLIHIKPHVGKKGLTVSLEA